MTLLLLNQVNWNQVLVGLATVQSGWKITIIILDILKIWSNVNDTIKNSSKNNQECFAVTVNIIDSY